jgi:predicted small lipoprotein YifL
MRPLLLIVAGCLQEGGLYLPTDDLAANPPVTLNGRQVTERFPEPAAVTSDVLWVVDNSCSMLEEQQRIADNADPFIQHFLDSRQLDWHIGFVTTDMFTDAGKGRMLEWRGERYLSRETPDAASAFRELILQGNRGPAPERGLDASWLALNEPLVSGYNQGFLRDDSFLHIIVISDQQDYSSRVTRAEYIAWLAETRGEQAVVSAITGLPTTSCAGWVEPGNGYIEVVTATGGVLVDICEPDWGPVLDDLGAVSSQGGAEYHLRQLPALDSMEVWVEEPNGQTYRFEFGDTWTYDEVRNSVKLVRYTPPPGTDTIIRYVPLSEWQAPVDTGG